MSAKTAAILLLLSLSILLAHATDPSEAKVEADRDTVLQIGTWIYNDLAKGMAEAKQTGKPMLVVFRCVP